MPAGGYTPNYAAILAQQGVTLSPQERTQLTSPTLAPQVYAWITGQAKQGFTDPAQRLTNLQKQPDVDMKMLAAALAIPATAGLGSLLAGAGAAGAGAAGGAGDPGGGTPIGDGTYPGAPGSGMDEFGNPTLSGGMPGGGAPLSGGGGLGSLGTAAQAAGQSGGGLNLGPLGKIGFGQLAQGALAGLDTVGGAAKFGKEGQLESQLLAQTQAQQKDRDALRSRLMASPTLGTIPQRPDLGSLFAGSQNPFARGMGPLQGGLRPRQPLPMVVG